MTAGSPGWQSRASHSLASVLNRIAAHDRFQHRQVDNRDADPVGHPVAGMAAGVGRIDGMNLLRDGAMATVFSGVRSTPTLGSH